ncbi:MAG: zeta toxin family protein [Bacteroidota bacterium]
MRTADNEQIPYLLSESDHESFYQLILSSGFERVSRGKANPIAYFLGAQPGSGKTILRQALGQYGEAVVVNTDDLRWFHPKFNSLLEDLASNERASYRVNPDSVEWSSRLFNDAVNARCNIILDSTLGGNVNHFISRLTSLKEAGYRNEIHLLAVNSRVSRLGIYYRFETGAIFGIRERMVSMDVHNRNYHALPDNLMLIANQCSNTIDRLVIYSRSESLGLNEIYSSQNPVAFESAIELLRSERERKFTELEEENFQKTIAKVSDLIEKRGGDLQRFLADIQ